MEVWFISLFNSRNCEIGYNIAIGGTGSETPSQETRQKISIGNTGKIRSEKTIKKLSVANSGKKHLKETIEKISLSNKGRIFTNEHKQHLSNSMKGANNHKYIYVDPDTETKIIELFISGIFKTQLSKDFNYSRTKINNILKLNI